MSSVEEAGFGEEDAFTLATVIFFLGIVLSEAFEQVAMCIFKRRNKGAAAEASKARYIKLSRCSIIHVIDYKSYNTNHEYCIYIIYSLYLVVYT